MKKITLLSMLFLPLQLLFSCNRGGEGDSNSHNMKPNDPTRIYASSGLASMSGRVYLWDEGNMPDRTRPTNNGGNRYADPLDFKPYMEVFTVPANVQPKGAVILCAGGAFMFRGNEGDTYPTMRRLVEHGYQVFVLQYRLRPWTMQEGSLDVARTLRFVRAHAADYRIHPKNIATAGYSAGGIQVGDEVWHYGKQITGKVLDDTYTPDALDQVDADPTAVGMIYSFYGVLSIASQDVSGMRQAQLPPTFFAYGTRDPFYEQFNINVRCLREAGITVEAKVLQNYPHGFGAGTTDADWINEFDAFLQRFFQK